jgi:site-specific recombinase XerC
VKFLPLDIIRKLLAAPDVCKPIGIRDRAILAFMALHGLRVSKVRQLNIADVNLEAGTVHVLGRGGKPRVVFLTEPTRKVIGAWLATRRLMQVDAPAARHFEIPARCSVLKQAIACQQSVRQSETI